MRLPIVYKIRVVEPARTGWNRHGTCDSKGGQFVAQHEYRWPDVPVYIAIEQMTEEFPGKTLQIIGLPSAAEREA